MRGDFRLWFGSVAVMLACAGSVCAGQGAGAITGRVRLTGPAPAPVMVQPVHDAAVCGRRARALRSLMLGPDQSVRDAIVYIDPSGSWAKTRSQDEPTVVLDQRDCEFVPRIQIARSGAPLILKNSDPLLHVVEIDSLSPTNQPKTLLMVATPYAGFEKRYQLANFTEPTLLRARCGNGHNWMAAYIAVMPHPWAALTDANGEFNIRNVPAGLHKVYAWHEMLGTLMLEARVQGGRAAVVSFEFGGAP
jgi:hypothetical protein